MQLAPHRPLGLTILEAVRAARVAADTNANLGIVLLTAPLAAVPDGEPLDAAAVARVLGRLDRDDAAAVYRAIAVGRPGGMGTADSWDVHGPAPDDILAAMQAAAGRDQIARLWSHGFGPLFAGAVADLGRSLAAGAGLCDAVVEAHLRQLASQGVFVSEDRGLTPKDHLWQLQADRFANSRHVELLGSLLTLKAPRVLEIRSRLGSISEALRRLYGAEVTAMAMFPNQRFLIKEVYGIRADAPLDFDHFAVPSEGAFDLIVANHMLTHSVRPGAFLASVRDRLAPGGHLYLYNEPLEDEFLRDEKSMFNTLNAFHLQTFNRQSFVRVLQASGFEIVHVGRDRHSLFCLARKAALGAEGSLAWEPMPEAEQTQRRSAYRKAYELSIVLLPDQVRPRFAVVWKRTLERVKSRGLVAPDARGRLRVMRAAD